MYPRDLATEFANQAQAMTKAQFLMLVAALEAAGGEVSIDPEELQTSATAPTPRLDISAYDGMIRLRLVRPLVIDDRSLIPPYSPN
jgi:hypothetical protein